MKQPEKNIQDVDDIATAIQKVHKNADKIKNQK